MIDRYESPETLAECSAAPVEVCRMVFAIAPTRDDMTELRSGNRKRNVCRKRMAVVWAACEYTRASLRPIGRALNMDYSWASRAYYQADALRKRDPGFRKMCEELKP